MSYASGDAPGRELQDLARATRATEKGAYAAQQGAAAHLCPLCDLLLDLAASPTNGHGGHHAASSDWSIAHSEWCSWKWQRGRRFWRGGDESAHARGSPS